MKALFITVCFLASLSSSAKHFEYHGASPLGLGLGVNLADPFEPQRSCLKFEEERMDGSVARKSEVNIRVVESKKELFRELGLSSSIAAQSFFISGDAGATYLDETHFQEDSLVWIVIGNVDFGRIRLKNPTLETWAADLLKEGKFEIFQKQCGMQYVSQERRGATIFAIYSLRNISNREKRDFKAWLNFHTSNIPFISVESKNKFSLSLAEFARTKQLSFRILAIGGQGIPALADAAKNENDIGKIREIVSSYLSGLTLENAVPVEFLTSSFEQFGWKPSAEVNWNKRDTVLGDYYFLASAIDADRKRLNEILHTQRDSFRYLSAEKLSEYRTLLEERNSTWHKLYAEAQGCIKDAEQCHFPKADLPTITWPRTIESLTKSSRVWLLHLPVVGSNPAPEMDAYECDAQRKFALRSGCIDEDEMLELEGIHAAPLCLSSAKGIGSLCYCEK